MKIDVLGVQAFIAISEHHVFHKAAGQLNISQTALTRRLQNLESYLGTKLVERTTRDVSLTTVGENFLPQARRLLSELSDAISEIRDAGRSQRGDVCIACVPTMGVQFLPRVIQLYSQRHPGNRIKVLDHSSAGVSRAVLSREAEFGITIAEQLSAELASHPLIADTFVLICREDHVLAKRRRVTWAELAGHRLIFPGVGSSNRPILDHALSDLICNVHSFYEVQRSATAVGLVAQGVGAAIVPRLAMLPGAHPNLRIVELVEPRVVRSFVLVCRKSAQLSPAAKALFQLIEQRAQRHTIR